MPLDEKRRRATLAAWLDCAACRAGSSNRQVRGGGQTRNSATQRSKARPSAPVRSAHPRLLPGLIPAQTRRRSSWYGLPPSKLTRALAHRRRLQPTGPVPRGPLHDRRGRERRPWGLRRRRRRGRRLRRGRGHPLPTAGSVQGLLRARLPSFSLHHFAPRLFLKGFFPSRGL